MLAKKLAVAMVQTQILTIQEDLKRIPEDGNPEYLYVGFLFADTVEWLTGDNGFEIRTETTDGVTKNYITPRHDLKLTPEEHDLSIELYDRKIESLDDEYSDGKSVEAIIDQLWFDEHIKSKKIEV